MARMLPNTTRPVPRLRFSPNILARRRERGLVQLILDILAGARADRFHRSQGQGPTEDPNRPWDFPEIHHGGAGNAEKKGTT